MQLAKNLYLDSEKTIGRKIQEAVLVVLLEQELAKHELMELYLNVIEFGPGIYGVRRAARHYFDEEPAELSLAQALYLSSILPNPDSSHFRADGSLSERWTAYLRKLMQIAHRIGRITEEELTAGLREEIRFREPSARADENSESTGGGFGDDSPPSELGRSSRSLEQPATP
jgi:membrane peptidoglycan carboxypeptidase